MLFIECLSVSLLRVDGFLVLLVVAFPLKILTAMTFTVLDCIYIWVIRGVTYKRRELLTLRKNNNSPPVFWWGSVLLIFSIFCVVLLCVFTFWVPLWCPLYDFCIKPMLVRLCLQLFCRMAYVLITLFVQGSYYFQIRGRSDFSFIQLTGRSGETYGRRS